VFLPTLKGAFIGLAAGVVLAFLLGRFGLFRRRNRIHNVLAKLWYAYIPILFAVAFAAWSFVSHGHSLVLGLADEMRPEVTAVSAEMAEAVLNELESVSGDIQVEQVMLLVGGHIDDYFGTSVLSGLVGGAGYVRRIADSIRPYVTNELNDYIAKRLFAAAAGRLNLPERRIVELWNTDIVTALKSGLVMDIILAQVDVRFASAYKTVKIFFIIFALIPAAEIALSLHKKRRPSAS
jgi:hypothetical protein